MIYPLFDVDAFSIFLKNAVVLLDLLKLFTITVLGSFFLSTLTG
jgi:hypothetical protein